MMISVVDAHVHVGQFGAKYFDPLELGKFLLRQGVVSCVASAPVAATGKHNEAVRDLGRLMSVAGLSVWPLLWVTPGLLGRHSDLAAPLRRLPYRGLKIHPRANKWSEALLDRAFRAAEERSIGILLHTDLDYPAGIYQDLLLRHPKVKVVLAHGRPIEQAQAVLRECPNAFVDTAFMLLPLIKGLVGQGFGDRIIFGSDAPIDRCFYVGSAVRRYRARLQAIQKALGSDQAGRVLGINCGAVFGRSRHGLSEIQRLRQLPQARTLRQRNVIGDATCAPLRCQRKHRGRAQEIK